MVYLKLFISNSFLVTISFKHIALNHTIYWHLFYMLTYLKIQQIYLHSYFVITKIFEKLYLYLVLITP